MDYNISSVVGHDVSLLVLQQLQMLLLARRQLPSLHNNCSSCPPTPLAEDAAVQAVEQTLEKAVQASSPHHQEARPSQGVLVLAEQAGQPLQAELPLHHRLNDLLCRDAEYLPALGQFPRVTDSEKYRVDRAREQEKDLENLNKMFQQLMP